MHIVDAHLDLSYNALKGRNVLLPAKEQLVAAGDVGGIPTVGLPDLRAGGVALVCATIFCLPAAPDPADPSALLPGYRDAEEAHAVAWRQYDWYRRQIDAGQMRFVTTAAQVRELPAESAVAPSAVAGVLLMEGADPFRTPADVAPWFDAGLRVVGLAWKRTRMAGGTGAPGGLTTEGVALVRELDRVGIIHDTSHLAEEAFWQLLEISAGPAIASHSNCRALVPGDRHLSDVMIRALVKRGGIIGINFFDRFLVPPEELAGRRATLRDVVRHVQHVCDLAGDARHVGLGTDMDGGLGLNEIPQEIRSSADLPALQEALATAGFVDEDVRAIVGGNWLRYFAEKLPGGGGEV